MNSISLKIYYNNDLLFLQGIPYNEDWCVSLISLSFSLNLKSCFLIKFKKPNFCIINNSPFASVNSQRLANQEFLRWNFRT